MVLQGRDSEIRSVRCFILLRKDQSITRMTRPQVGSLMQSVLLNNSWVYVENNIGVAYYVLKITKFTVTPRRKFSTIQVLTHCHGRTIAQTVSRRLLTAEARIRAPVRPCVICDVQSGTGTGFSPNLSVSPVNIILPLLHIHSCII
jgi:hypothetical protein